MTHINCRLTAKNRDHLRKLCSVIEYGLALGDLFTQKKNGSFFSASRCSTIITVAYRVVSHSNSRRSSRLLCRRKFHRRRPSVWHAELTVIHSQSRQQFYLRTPSIRSSDISSCDVTKPTSRYNCHVVGIARYNENPMGMGTEVCQK